MVNLCWWIIVQNASRTGCCKIVQNCEELWRIVALWRIVKSVVELCGLVEGYTGSQHLTNAVWAKDDRGEHDDSDDDDGDDGDVQDGYETWVKAEVC